MSCTIPHYRLAFEPSGRKSHHVGSAHRRLKTSLGATIATFRLWSQKSRQRRALLDLDDHMLNDIGITREEAARFWR